MKKAKSPSIMTVKEMKEILNNYSDYDKIYIVSLHYNDYSAAFLNIHNTDTNDGEQILEDSDGDW